MTELGKLTVSEHKSVGRHVSKVADMFVAVGQRISIAADVAVISGMNKDRVVVLKTSREAGEYVKDRLERGDIVLLKGSQVTRMERAVEKLLAHPEEAHDLLVRQDKGWLRR